MSTPTALASLTLPQTRRRFGELVLRHRWLLVGLWWAAHLFVDGIYALLRGQADDAGFPRHGAEIERTLFGSLPTIWLQDNIFSLSPQFLEWSSVIVHASWFFVPAVAFFFVTLRRPNRIGSLFRWIIALQVLGLLLFTVFPMRPPWMDDGEVTRVLALRFGGQIAEDPNQLAAMPSLHVAYPLLLGLWFVRERWKAPAILMLSYSALIAFEVVFSGEHYIVDVLGSGAVAGSIFYASKIDYAAALRGARRFAASTIARPAAEPALAVARSVHERQGGQALIEFAFALPVIFLFMLVLVDFGIALDHRIVMQHAVSEGVREAAFNPDANEIKLTTEDQSQGLVTPADVTVCYINYNGNGELGDVGDKVQVSAAYTYNFSAGGGELMQAIGVTPPSILMDPTYTTGLQVPVPGATACP